jgi:hypothetical protein
MPSAIVATPGAADANSFASVAEYIAYAADRLDPPDGVTVSGGTVTDRETQALLEAARDLDALPWPGVSVSGTQRLAFPRYVAVNEVWRRWALDASGYYVGDAAIPRRLKEAQIELAFAYLSGESPMQADTNAGVVRKKVDVLETEWAPGARPQGFARYPRVLALIAPLLGSGGAVVRT